MTIELDHILVFCAAGAPEAAALVARGFIEGSGRSHRGQGTANRCFSFGNAYLELLWVENEAEARSDVVLPVQLWERWQRRHAGACRFGLAFRPGADASNSPPFPTWSYQPAYLPPGLSIEIAQGIALSDPLLFFLPFALNRSPPAAEPRQRSAQIDTLATIRLAVPGEAAPSAAFSSAIAAGLVQTRDATEYLLEIGFAGARATGIDLRPELPIVFGPVDGS